MDTLKTAVIVVLLLAVVYGAYVVLSKPDAPLPQEIAWHEQKSSEPLQIEMGTAEKQPSLGSNKNEKSTDKFDSMWSSDSKSAEAKSSSHTTTPNNLASDLVGVPKPSSAGLGSMGTPSNLDKPVDNQKLSEPTVPAAAPNLLGAASSSQAKSGSEQSSKGDSGSDLPSLPDLRSVPGENKPSANDTSLPPGNGAVAGVSPVGSADAASATSSASANDLTKTGANGLAAPGSPDPALGPISDSASTSTGSPSVTTSAVYEAALREAQWQMDEGKWQSALSTLSKFLNSPDLGADQLAKLYDLLDPLAAKVIYSPEHLIEAPYEVRRGDRLADIAQSYQVPWELLANINGIENPDLLVPGTKLKVIRGPFRADIDLKANELTLFAGQLYAGRFPISVGKDPEPKPGEYRVQEKQPGRVYYAGDGRTIPAEDATNPYGRAWIGLGNELSIHSSPEGGDAKGMGCISLSPLDATDVYSILSQGSTVVIRR